MSSSANEELQDYFDDLLGAYGNDATALETNEKGSPAPQTAFVTDSEVAADLTVKEPSLQPQLKEAVTPPRALPEKPEPIPEPPKETPQADLETEAKAKLARMLEAAPVEIQQTVAVEPEVALEVKKEVKHEIRQELKQETEQKLKQEVEQQQDIVTETDVSSATELSTETATDQSQNSYLTSCENGRPVWAQNRFEVLLFDVAGLTLAVPLISLGQIHTLTDDLTPLFGQADWLMGLLPTPMGKVRTINTAKFVMPDRYKAEFEQNLRYVVSIDGLPWGLAVDKVNQPITLQPDDVRWRTERSKRPWLAGTVKEHMCALMDVAAMGELLQKADVKGSRQDPLKS